MHGEGHRRCICKAPLSADEVVLGLTVYCDLSDAGKWQTATLGFRGPSCPT